MPNSRAYKSIDDAALGGFKRILMNNRQWETYEFGFLIIGTTVRVVRQLGHEGFMDSETQFFYTEPHGDESTGSVDQSIPGQYAMLVRAFCHTHPTPGTFSTGDFNNFKKLRKLKANHRLAYDVIYYLMESDRTIRRSDSEENFREGRIIDGINQATP